MGKIIHQEQIGPDDLLQIEAPDESAHVYDVLHNGAIVTWRRTEAEARRALASYKLSLTRKSRVRRRLE